VTRWQLAGAGFPARVWTASGCGGTGRELAAYVDLTRIGAFVTRTITLEPTDGTPGRRVVEVPGGLLNAIGTQNPGLDAFLATELPWLAQQQVPVVVSIAADEPGEYAELSRRVGPSPGVRGVEMNLSLPAYADDHRLGNRMGNTFQIGKLVGTVRAEVPRGVPVLAKLGPREDVVALARAGAEGGADAVVLVNAAPAPPSTPRPGRRWPAPPG
jgi:dihydroorotate dehydrogenase (NAD+) catalytic subunit